MRSARFRLAAVLLGGLGLLASLAAAFLDPTQFYPGWLFGFLVWIGISLGALLLLMAHDLTGGGWGESIRAPLTAATASLPVALLAFLPLLTGLGRLYSWLRPEEAAKLANGFYLNRDFFLLRALCYFILWLVLAALALRPPPRRASAPGLVLASLSATFAAFDWTMSLEPHWSSTIYGLFATVTQVEAALALATLCAIAAAAPPERLADLGSLLFAAVLLWAYLAFMQFLIIWEENLPDEITWYLKRVAGGWEAVTIAIAFCAVALPFAVLVWWPLKRRPVPLAAAALILLAGYLLTQCWLVFPALPQSVGWPAAAAFFAIGGPWLALADFRLDRGRLLPRHSSGAGHA
jgi:hypothetical protein